MSVDEFEGRIGAHREMLTKLLMLLADDPHRMSEMVEWLEERTRVQDHQEDPGAVIMEAFAEQEARAREFRIVSDDVKALLEARRR